MLVQNWEVVEEGVACDNGCKMWANRGGIAYCLQRFKDQLQEVPPGHSWLGEERDMDLWFKLVEGNGGGPGQPVAYQDWNPLQYIKHMDGLWTFRKWRQNMGRVCVIYAERISLCGVHMIIKLH